MTVAEIARLVGGDFEGDADLEIRAGNAVEAAAANEIAFVRGDSIEQARNAAAGCLLVPSAAPAFKGRTVIRVERPRAAFAKTLRALHPVELSVEGIHPAAVVAASATLGEGVAVAPGAVIEERVEIGAGSVIGPQTTIGRGAVLGADCRLSAGVVLYPGVSIGNRVILHAGCIVGADGFGYVFEGDHYEKFPQVGTVEIGDDVELGANVCVDRGALGATIIGAGTKLDNMVHVGHNCRIGQHVVIAAQTGLSGGCVVEDYVVMGGQVGMGEQAHIGAKARIGGQSGVLPHRRVPAGQTVWGTPSRPHREYLKKRALAERLPEMAAKLHKIEKRLDAGLSAKQEK